MEELAFVFLDFGLRLGEQKPQIGYFFILLLKRLGHL